MSRGQLKRIGKFEFGLPKFRIYRKAILLYWEAFVTNSVHLVF